MARIYIANLPHSTNDGELKNWLEGEGFEVHSVQVMIDSITGMSRGFAFAELAEADGAKAAEALDHRRMEGHDLHVTEAHPLEANDDGKQIGGTRSPRKIA